MDLISVDQVTGKMDELLGGTGGRISELPLEASRQSPR